MNAPVLISLLSAFAAGLCAAFVALRASQVPSAHTPAARAFVAVLVLEVLYAVGFASENASTSLGQKLFWDSVTLLPTVAMPLVLVHFAQIWVGGERGAGRIRRNGWLVLSTLPLASCLLVFTDPWHGHARADARLVQRGVDWVLTYSFSAVEWAVFAELYLLTAYGVGFTLVRTFRRSPPYRLQGAAVAFATALPVLGSIPGMFLDVVLFGQRDGMVVVLFGAGALAVTWALYARRLFDLAPIPYDALLDQLPLALVVLDARERVVEANPAARALFRFDRDVTGLPVEQVTAISPAFATALAALREGVPEVTIEGRVFELGNSPLRSASRFTGRLIKLHDVSDRRRAEDEVRRARDALELRVAERTRELSLANEALRGEMEERRAAEAAREELKRRLETAGRLEALGRLAGGVAHDFNNLLTVILGNTSLLLAQLTEDESQELLTEIDRAGQSAASLTQQLLAFARRQVVDPRVVDLVEAVDGAQRMIARLLGEDIEVRAVHPPVNLRARIDPAQLEQILVNLCVNARDAMPRGGVLTIETGFSDSPPVRPVGGAQREVPPGQAYGVVSVTDTGTGISPELLDRIFEPFFTTKQAGSGTGLGLATVYGTVEQAGGWLAVESEPGRGTKFEVFLPTVAEAPETRPMTPSPRPERGGTIALIEDQASVRDVTRRQLSLLGYEVLDFAAPEEALQRLPARLHEIELVVSDVIMPQMDGPTLVAALRKWRPSLPVLFITGYAEDALGERGEGVRGSLVLAKPFDLTGLSTAVSRAIATGSEASRAAV